MMKRLLLVALSAFLMTAAQAQDDLPFDVQGSAGALVGT